jgi:polyphosphate kinase
MSEIINKLWQKIRPAQKTRPPMVNIPATELLPDVLSNARYLNREISDIQFIQRVVEESDNANVPLFERVRFLAISAAVLDQFYTVRVAKLNRLVSDRILSRSIDGLTPEQQLTAIGLRADSLMSKQEAIWQSQKTELQAIGISITEPDSLSTDEKNWLSDYFRIQIMPVLTPFTLDEEHPFPYIPSGGMCVALQLENNHILLPVPANLPRFISIMGMNTRYVLLEDILAQMSSMLLPNVKLLSSGTFQILRDNDLAKKERTDDLRSIVESGLKKRHKANVIRLKVNGLSEANLRFISQHLGLLNETELEMLEFQGISVSSKPFIIETVPGLSQISDLIDNNRFPTLVYPPHQPRYPQRMLDHNHDCFSTIKEKDLLVHWPYESFDVVVRFLEQAAVDEDVLSIKQTLYRTSDDSPIVNALVEAARRGKTVVAVVELEARDNEHSNVALAKRLENAGVQILYGIIGLKIHCKLTVITRREDDTLAIYCHFGTGNYHPGNAKTYTDLSFFTRDAALCQDANLVLNYITSESFVAPNTLAMAPFQLRDRIYRCIDAEIEHARAGKNAQIWLKINSLTDPDLIERFYEASEAGVEIDLVIRRHCSLRPGIPGMSSRIRVKSIVGRFLEHSRIYCFANGERMSAEHADIYLASADLMERNLDERAEVMVPLADITVRKQVLEQIMKANILDNKQSWQLRENGEWERASMQPEAAEQHQPLFDQPFCAQTWFAKTDSLSGLGSLRAKRNIPEVNLN